MVTQLDTTVHASTEREGLAKRSGLLGLCTVALLASLTACTLTGRAIDGQVLEEGTNKPIPGAIVVVTWAGDLVAFAESQHVCVHVESAATDSTGHFHTKAWHTPSRIGWVRDLTPEVIAYKPGYAQSPTSSDNLSQQWLTPFRGTRGERLEYLSSGWVGGCGEQDGSAKNLIPLFKAQYEEAQHIAISNKDRELVDGLLTGVETLEYGSNIADQHREQRRLERLKEKQ